MEPLPNIEAVFALGGLNPRKVVVANAGGVAVLTLMTRPGILHRHLT